ncbi:DUF2167 domain-containing protein [Oligoflexus tunisiensis]|uniref:DUF2167 domain-containing protein n=1 Tax=Oligoflexus tunisiensis TaxID=708132 RepID=UPI00114CBE6B|nr:DUF2167 domain-containing protein [Oligoflexus tunisiensis]
MMNLRRLLLYVVSLFCHFSAHGALADSVYRLDDEHFSLRLDSRLRFIDAKETARIMIEDWGNPAPHVMEQNPLGMIVDQNFPKGSTWGIVMTASHDGHIPDKDAKSIDNESILQILRKEYKRMNSQRKAAGTAPVTSLDWALEPQYDRRRHQITWAKTIGFGRNETRTLNYAVRILGRENAIHLNAVGPMDQLAAITRSMQAVIAGSAFDEGYRYEDFNALYHRTADYGLVGLVAGPSQQKTSRWEMLWQNLGGGSSHFMIAGLFGFVVVLGRWLTRRRLPEF